MFGRSAEHAHANFVPGDSFVAEGYTREVNYERNSQSVENEEFVAKKIDHDAARRLRNQAFFTKVFIDEDGELRGQHNRPFEMLLDPQVNANALTWAADTDKARTSTNIDDGLGSSLVRPVDAMERYGNRRPRVERLVSAWNQGIRADTESEDGSDDPLIGAAAEPKKRPRTCLTDEEVDAMRTARAQGVSVNALARRFGVHRGTVWAKTR